MGDKRGWGKCYRLLRPLGRLASPHEPLIRTDSPAKLTNLDKFKIFIHVICINSGRPF